MTTGRTVRVRFLQAMASPTGSAQPGQVRDLPEAEARTRIRAGQAAAVDDRPRPSTAEAEAGGEAQAQEPDGRPMEAWTVPELRAHADEHGIDLGPATRKADIIAAIAAAAENQDDSGGE